MSHYMRLFASLVCSLWCVAACAVTTSTTQLTFGSLPVGTSRTQGVTLTNSASVTSAGPVFFSASLSAISGVDFAYQTNCPNQISASSSGLSVGSSCSYQVTFAPTIGGGETQTLNINVYSGQGAAGTLIQQLSISLSGTGVATPAVTLSQQTIDFGAYLVDSISTPLVETVTNSGTAPLVIQKIETKGENHEDFSATFGTLPITLGPGQSTGIKVIFTPYSPWEPGTRQARLRLSDNAGEQIVPLIGMGVTCAGPIFAAASNGRCADSDGDGFNDAWEDNGYIDLNNNGQEDTSDFHFPHRTPYVFSPVSKTGSGQGRVFPTVSDPTQPIDSSTVVVTIASPGPVGTATFTYSVNQGVIQGPIEVRPVVNIAGNLRLMFFYSDNGYLSTDFVAGDTFSFSASMGSDTVLADKNRPNIYLKYDYMGYDAPGNACTLDSDCADAGNQPNNVCHAGFCSHNHSPGDPLFRKVVEAFDKHGITLYIDPVHQAVPHARVVTWAKAGSSGAQTSCAGANVVAGNIGPGQFAVNFHDIKNRPGSPFALDPLLKSLYHYTVFGHASTCLTDAPGQVGSCPACPPDRSAPTGTPRAGSTGTAELPGNDFIMSLGDTETNPIASSPADPFLEGGVFMHELGHNLGLHHAGDLPAPEVAPNYLSVMNYLYSFSGVAHAATPGSSIPVEELQELNYSDHELNTLVETNLNEAAGVSPLSSGYTGIVYFYDRNGANGAGPEAGPIDWNGNGVIDPNLVVVNVNGLNGATETMRGYRDWDHDALTGGACTKNEDCRINAVRQNLHNYVDPTIDPHEPCVQQRCQSLWVPFQNTPWGKVD